MKRLLLATFAVYILPAVPAVAAEVSLCKCGPSTLLRVVAAPGEVNSPTLRISDGQFFVGDRNGVVTPKDGCTAAPGGAGTALCPLADVDQISITLGDGNDSADFSGFSSPPGVQFWVYGDVGNDLIRGTRGSDFLVGQDGNDRVLGNGGNDLLDGGKGDDLVQGQGRLLGTDGTDTFRLYVTKAKPGRVRSQVYGWAGNDRIYARNGVRDLIDCGSGRDLVASADRSRGDTIRRDCERRVR